MIKIQTFASKSSSRSLWVFRPMPYLTKETDNRRSRGKQSQIRMFFALGKLQRHESM